MKHIAETLKVGDLVRVTLVSKGEYSWLKEGTTKVMKVTFNKDNWFNIKKKNGTPLLHMDKWEASFGLFDLYKGMIVKIEKSNNLRSWLSYYL